MRTTIVVLTLLLGFVLVACAAQAPAEQETQEPLEEEFPELAEIDAMLAELDELDRQLALSSDLEDLDLELE